MVLPPPNVTGVLHIGHALTVTVEDSVARFHRLAGRNVTWAAGFDHAGIATQTAVEKWIWKEKRLRRHSMDKEEFLRSCVEWKERFAVLNCFIVQAPNGNNEAVE